MEAHQIGRLIRAELQRGQGQRKQCAIHLGDVYDSNVVENTTSASRAGGHQTSNRHPFPESESIPENFKTSGRLVPHCHSNRFRSEVGRKLIGWRPALQAATDEWILNLVRHCEISWLRSTFYQVPKRKVTP
jgi:hypothetical protein